MAAIQAATRLQWSDATAAQSATRLQWEDAVAVQSVGSAYSPPAGPAQGVAPTGGLAAAVVIAEQLAYGADHLVQAVDLRDDSPLELISGAIDLSDGSAFWSLEAQCPAAVAAALESGEQPPSIRVTINGITWAFIVESIDAPQAFASTVVKIRGRSLAAAADAPWQPVAQWLMDAPTTAAQAATLAQTASGLEVRWQAADWLIPAGALSVSATGFGVISALAQSISAVVEADADGYGVRVSSRYARAPNLWAASAPDWQIHWNAIESSSSRRNDTPDYDSVLVTGQQQGGLLLARAAGTSGSAQAPMVSDPLLTDLPALQERASVVLWSAGRSADVVRTLQLGPQGYVPRGAIVRFVDPAETWCGMVRSVSIRFEFAKVRQTIGIERRLSFPAGTVAPDPLLVLTIPPAGKVGQVANGVVAMAGGTGSVPFTLSCSPAASITPSSGTLTVEAPSMAYTILPASVGDHSVTIVNSAGLADPPAAVLVAAPADLVTVGTIADQAATVGTAFSLTGLLSKFSGGVTPYTLSIASGTLPTGLTLDGSGGTITGTPSAVLAANSVVLRCTDSLGHSVDQSAFLFSAASAGVALVVGGSNDGAIRSSSDSGSSWGSAETVVGSTSSQISAYRRTSAARLASGDPLDLRRDTGSGWGSASLSSGRFLLARGNGLVVAMAASGSSGNVRVSSDGGVTWGSSLVGLASASLTFCASSGLFLAPIFSGTFGLYGVMRSADMATRLFTSFDLHLGRIMGCSGSTVLGVPGPLEDTYPDRIHRSTDGGVSWTPIDTGLNIGSAYAAGDGAGTWVMGSPGGGFYRSTNDGVSWSAMSGLPSGSGFARFVHTGTEFLVLVTTISPLDSKLYASSNGTSWSLRYTFGALQQELFLDTVYNG